MDSRRLSELRSLNLGSDSYVSEAFCGAVATAGDAGQGIEPFHRAYGACSTVQLAGAPTTSASFLTDPTAAGG